MLFRITVCFNIFLFLLNIYFYIITFSESFALNNKKMYNIVSIFNDFIFIGCTVIAIKALSKTKLNVSTLFFLIPTFYTLLLFFWFR